MLKIGGSVLTYKNKPFTTNKKNLERISKEIKQGYDPEKMRLILVHGAGSFGHYMVRKSRIYKGIKNKKQLLDFAKTQTKQNYWNSVVTESLQKENLPAIPIQASSSAVMSSVRLISMSTKVVEGLLKIGMIVTFYGVPAFDRKQKCSILSGDQIVSYLAKRLNPKRIIYGTDVDGIYTLDPKKDKKAKLIKTITMKNWKDVKRCLSVSSSIDVTHGMIGKVKEIMNLVKLGLECEIINANKSGYVERTLKGERGLGTIIKM